MKITTKEVNRKQKLLFQGSAPVKFMYGGKPVKFAALGDELTSNYIEKYSSRWEPSYTKLKPSQVYSNWFNYMPIEYISYYTSVQNAYRRFEIQWNKRKSVESTIVDDNSNSAIEQDIVRLLNPYTLDNSDHNNKFINMDRPAGIQNDKWKSLSFDPYTYDGIITGGNNLSDDYPAAYRTVSSYTGYSVCKDFLNNYNFSISITVCGKDIYDTGYIVNGPRPIITIPIYNSNHQLETTFQVWELRNHSLSDIENTCYLYGDFMYDPKYPSGESVANTALSNEKFYTNITPSVQDLRIDNPSAENLSQYWISDVTNVAIDHSLYPIVNFIVTCDKNILSLYVNGNLCSYTDISSYINKGCYFFDTDLLISRDVTLNNDGTIQSQTLHNSAWLKTNNINVFRECLNSGDISNIFSISTQHLSSPYWGTHYQGNEQPGNVEEISGPQLHYSLGETFNASNAFYVLHYRMETSPGTFITTRNKNVSSNIQWTIEDSSVFETGGSTHVTASYNAEGVTFQNTYTIEVTQSTAFVLTKLDSSYQPTGEVYNYMYTDLEAVQTRLASSDNLWDVQIADIFNDGVIPERMLDSCNGIYSLSICEGFHTIQGYAFNSCANLNVVHLPNTLQDLYGYVFASTPVFGTDSIVYVDNWLVKYLSATGAITIREGTRGIQRGLFNGNKNITSVQLPDSLRALGYRCFYNCTKLASIDIPSGISYIGQECFANAIFTEITLNTSGPCTIETSAFPTKLITLNIGENASYIDPNFLNISTLKTFTVSENNTVYNVQDNVLYNKLYTTLIRVPQATTSTSISLPNTIASISDSACEGCVNIQSIMGLENVLSIGNRAFYGCTKLTTANINCTFLGSYCFYNCTSLAQLTLGNCVTDIPDYAFYGCNKITGNLDLSNVTTIGTEAFRNCASITNITLGSNLTKLPNGVFYGCGNLNSININNVTSLGDEVFRVCTSLTSITLSDNLAKFGEYVFYGCTSLQTTHLPTSLLLIPAHSFDTCSALTTINMPNNLESIGDYAFNNCTLLANITIPNSVTYIGTYAFNGCSCIENITLPENVTVLNPYVFCGCSSITNIQIHNNISNVGNYSLSGTSISSIVMPNTVQRIGVGVFSNCSNLTDVTISKTDLDVVPTAMFAGCSSLQELTLPNAITTLQTDAFKNCTSLSTIHCSWENLSAIESSCFQGCTALTTLDISTSAVVNIDVSTFQDCTSLQSVMLPTAIRLVRAYAFQNCSSLINVNIDNIVSLGNYAFDGCSNLQTLTVPNSVTSLGTYAFRNCSKLTAINVPNTITSIGSYTFCGCSSLTSISIPNTVTGIGTYAFDGCTSLATIKMTTKVTSIGSYAFRNCSALTSISLPSTLSTLSSYVFENCSALTSITVPSKVTLLNTYVFHNCSSLKTITLNGSVTRIYPNALQGCTSLNNFTIPSTVTNIGEYAFNECSSLTTITIPKATTTLGNYAFLNCSSLTAINITSGNTKFSSVDGVLCNYAKTQIICYPIGNTATEYTFPSTITSTANKAFAYSYNLQIINIPSSVTTMPATTFSDSSGIQEINIDKKQGSISNSPWGATSATINWLQS